MEVIVETERLYLREIHTSDVSGMFELDSDLEVHTYLGSKPVSDKSEILDTIHFIRRQYVDHGIGRWAIIGKENNEFIGWTGLKFVTEKTNNHKNYYDLGYRLIKAYWGQGIATETAKASLKYAFDKLELNDVYAIADCNNTGSNRILEKVGLRFIETFDLDGVEHNWYKITRSVFKSLEG